MRPRPSCSSGEWRGIHAANFASLQVYLRPPVEPSKSVSLKIPPLPHNTAKTNRSWMHSHDRTIYYLNAQDDTGHGASSAWRKRAGLSSSSITNKGWPRGRQKSCDSAWSLWYTYASHSIVNGSVVALCTWEYRKGRDICYSVRSRYYIHTRGTCSFYMAYHHMYIRGVEASSLTLLHS